MLTLIESGFSSLGEEELIKLIKADVDSKKRTYLFVPEQQTLSRERAMCDILHPSSALCFEVTNFTRFANTAFRALGGISGEYADNASSALIMWRTLTELAPSLSLTGGKPNVSSGTVSKAQNAVKEIENLGITPEELMGLSITSDSAGKRLNEKVSDLALIYALYKRLLKEHYSDVSTDTAVLAQMLSENTDFLKNVSIYIDSFTSFTEPQYKLIYELIKSANVTVRLTIPKHLSEGFEYTEIRDTHKRLTALADRCGERKRILRPDSPDITKASVIQEIADLLWTTSGEINNDSLHSIEQDGGRVRIFAAETPFDECDFIAADIKKQVMAGAKFSDFAIVARNADDYLGILDLSLDSVNIPYFYSKKKDLSSFEAIKLINTAYAICARGFAREDVLTYLKCGLAGITRGEGDIFESYVYKWEIDGVRFTSSEAWEMNPRGYEKMTEEDALLLEKITDIRERLITPLIDLKSQTREAKTVRQHATVLYRFLSSLNLEKTLYDKACELKKNGEVSRAIENQRLWKVICACLDRLVTVLGDTRSDLDSFINQFAVVLKEYGMAQIPAHIDEVTVGSADMLRLANKSHVYLIGVNEGEFPRTVNDDAYFTERDKVQLSSLGLSIEPDLDIKGARELYAFSRAFTSAKKSVTLLYSRRTAALAPILPASPIERIKNLTRGIVTPIDISSLSIKDKLYSEDVAFELFEKASENERAEIKRAFDIVNEKREKERRDLLALKPEAKDGEILLGGEALGMLYKGDLYLSQSRIESYMRCPFSYFLKYNLKLNDAERADLSSNVIGSFIHAILEDFFRDVRENGLDISRLTDNDKLKLTERASMRYVNEFLGGGSSKERTKIAINRLCRSALPVIDGICDEFADCKFVPAFFELSTDGKAPGNASPIVYEDKSGKRVIIRGKVDRVDTYHKDNDVYVRVVDYKTGSKEFSPDDMAEGINMQMFLYLQSIVQTDTQDFRDRIGLKEGGELVPAGVIYAKTSIRDATVKHASDEEAKIAARDLSSREGMLLDEEASISAMNPRYTPLSYPETTKNEKANAKRKYTREGWVDICKSMESAILDISEKMRSGNISIAPREIKKINPCDRCTYRAICRKAEK